MRIMYVVNYIDVNNIIVDLIFFQISTLNQMLHLYFALDKCLI